MPATNRLRPAAPAAAGPGPGDEEDTAERQHRAVGSGRVGRAEPRAVLGAELGAPAWVSAASTGRRPLPLYQSRDRVVAGQHVQVGGLPGVHLAPGRGERAEVAGGLTGLPVQLDAAEQRPPPGRRGQLAQDRVTGLVEVAGKLERQPAARGQPLGHASAGPDDPAPTAAPRWRRARRPAARAASPGGRPGRTPAALARAPRLAAADPTSGRSRPACLDHRRRVVHPEHVGPWPARGQHGGQVARPAAQVNDLARARPWTRASRSKNGRARSAANCRYGGGVPHARRRFS